MFRRKRNTEEGLKPDATAESRPLGRVKRWGMLAVLIAVSLAIGVSIYIFAPKFSGGLEHYGYLGAFLLTLICSATILFPTPGFIVIFAMVVNPVFSWPLVALAAAVGGGLGESTAYFAGYGGNVIIAPEKSKRYKRAMEWTRRYGGVGIFLFSLAPFLPFDLAGLAAGAMRYPFWKFLTATLAGRLIRSFTECYLVYLGWGIWSSVLEFLSTLAWWVWVIVALCAIAIMGGIIVAIWWRKRARA